MHSRAQFRQLRAVVIRNAMRSVAWMRKTIAQRLPVKADRTAEAVATEWKRIKDRDVDRAQWRRWYKANRHYQRQCRAMRSAGYRGFSASGLPRWSVR